MSQLKEGLNSILVWLQQQQKKHPTIVQNWWLRYYDEKYTIPYLKPRLSEEQIRGLERKLDIKFTSEINDLYCCFDGTEFGSSIWDSDWLFDINLMSQKIKGVGLLSLKSLVTEYIDKQNFYQTENYQHLNLVPYPLSHLSGLDIFIGQNYREGCFVIESKNILLIIRIRDYQANSNNTLAMYSSLTNMVLTVAEFYQQAYDFDSQGNLHKDLDKMRFIWQKYNTSYFVEKTRERFNSIKDKLIELELDISMAWLQELGDILILTQDRYLLESLIEIMIQPPTNTLWDVNLNNLRAQASQLIVRSQLKQAIQLLIKQLNSQDWLTRYWTVQTLGKIGDSSIIQLLQQLLQDKHESVRLATQRAIKNIQQQEGNNKVIIKEKTALNSQRDRIIVETDRLMNTLNLTVTEGKEYLLKHYHKRSRHHLTDEELFGFRDYLKSKLDNLEIVETDLNDLIQEIDRLMEQLNWTKEDGQAYLLVNYRKKSRLLLTDEEILEFRATLQEKVNQKT
jgi:hypothetical protein